MRISNFALKLFRFNYLAREMYRQIAAYFLSRMTPFLIVWWVRKGEGGGNGGPIFTRDCQESFDHT